MKQVIKLVVLTLLIVVLGGCSKNMENDVEKLSTGGVITDKTIQQDKLKEVDGKDKLMGNVELPASNFEFDEKMQTYSGDVFVRGYLTTEETPEPWCEGTDCGKNTSAFFKVVEVDDSEFDKFLDENKGNSFVRDGKVGLGCVADNETVYLMNDSDQYGLKEFTAPKELSKILLSSTEKNLVTLKLTKYKLTDGRGAPACYSHFSRFELVK